MNWIERGEGVKRRARDEQGSSRHFNLVWNAWQTLL